MTTLKEIEEVWSTATPGPWRTDNWRSVIAANGTLVASTRMQNALTDSVAIAKAPEHIAWLVERVKELEAAGNALAEDAEHMQRRHPQFCFSGDRLRAWGALVDP